MSDLSGKVVLVTGAARGIGRAIAERLARDGADVALADVRADRLEESVAAVERHGARALALSADVTQKAEVDAMVQGTLDRLGGIDALFSNAGVVEVEPFLEAEEASWDRIMAVNAKGVFLCGQAAARAMIPRNGGCIVNVASIASRIGIPDMAAYSASKAAVVSLTRSMALALAPHRIRVNAVAPGIVDTDMWTKIDAQRAALANVAPGGSMRRRIADIPLGRAATADEIASFAVFFLGPAAQYVTGQTYTIDGGCVPD